MSHHEMFLLILGTDLGVYLTLLTYFGTRIVTDWMTKANTSLDTLDEIVGRTPNDTEGEA